LRAIAQNGTQRDSRAEAAVMTKSVLNDQQVPLSTLPPSQTQKRFALAIVLVLFAAFCATVPFATVPLPYFREFILIELIDAMANQKWPRILRITSAIEGPSSVVISVTDTGEHSLRASGAGAQQNACKFGMGAILNWAEDKEKFQQERTNPSVHRSYVWERSIHAR
jgi:hypothetical protein